MKVGAFDMPMADYLSSHGISQSALKHLARSPAHLREYVDHPKPSTPDQVLGTLLHYSVFQPHLFLTSHWVKPLIYVNKKGEEKKWNANATECKEWLANHKDRTVISSDDLNTIASMQESVRRHPAAKLALETGKAEQSLFCEDAETGLQLKCRCDWLSGNAIVDLKKCQDASPNGFARTVANYGYEIQGAFNLHIANALGLGKENFLFIAVEDQAPFAVGVYKLDQASIDIGMSKFRRLMERYMECVSSGNWPAYSKNVEYLSLPKWAQSAEMTAVELDSSPPVPALAV